MYCLTKNKPSFFRKNQSKVLLAFWIALSLSGGGDWRQPKGNYIIMLILGGHEKLLKGTL